MIFCIDWNIFVNYCNIRIKLKSGKNGVYDKCEVNKELLNGMMPGM